ncbi:MAG: methyltransferase domain-containing protein [Pseudomonadota bacterium]
MSAVLSRNSPRIGNREAFTRRHSAWASGDYAVVGNALQMVSEQLCERVNLCQDERVLDVAAGNFHASMAAARRWCEVTATDFASDLAGRSRPRLEVSALGVQLVDADAEALPFPDQSFSAVISAFGVMFAGDQERAASEMIRVCRRGRRLGLASWTPDGFMGHLFQTITRHAPGCANGASPFDWGTEQRLDELFAVYGRVESTRKRVALRARTPMDWVDKLRASYSPVLKIFAQLDGAQQKALRSELLELVQRFNRAQDSTMLVDAEYLEVVVQRR